jgi:hypothetical protein
MAIEETKKKIHFLPYVATKGRVKDTAPAPAASVSRKYNRITFSRALIQETGMAGKFVRLYFEPNKKVIGWQLRETVAQNEMKSWKLCRVTPSGNWGLNIKKMLSMFVGLNQEKYSELPVQKYRETSALDEHHGEVFYFVQLVGQSEKKANGDDK